ncbi:hypothetical protein ACOMHN_048513 [Nucella lapillus]
MEEYQSQTAKVGDGERQVLRNKKYAPATGIQSDFEKILTTFVETKSVRYEDFAKIWREKKLSLICAGRSSDRETVEFMEECMKVAVKMLLPPYGFQARVGALYLLYGLYLTQPCLPKVKIRVTREDWEHVKSLEDEFKRQSHHDTNFILQKLLLDGAFYFCAVAQEARSRYSQSEETNKSMAESLREDRQRIDSLFSDEILQQLGMIHGRYHKQKVRVAGPDASRPDRSLDVLHDKFPTSVGDVMQQHHERWKAKESQRQGVRGRSLPTIAESEESEEGESDPDYQPATTVGQRRARLKAMAYRGVKNKQRYKHRVLATESSSSEKGSPPKKKRGRPRATTNKSSIQPAPMTTIREQEEEDAAATESNALFSMPQFEEPPTEDKKPGRKRKNSVKGGSSSTPAKKQIVEKNTDTTGDREEQSEDVMSPTKRRRGRPSKPKAGSSRQRRPVGRPPKEQAGEASEPKKPENKEEEKKTKKKSEDGEAEKRKAKVGDLEIGGREESSVVEVSPPTSAELSPSSSSEAVGTTSAEPQQSTSGETLEQLPTIKAPHSGKDKATRGRKRTGSGGDRGKGAMIKVAPLPVSAVDKGKKKP